MLMKLTPNSIIHNRNKRQLCTLIKLQHFVAREHQDKMQMSNDVGMKKTGNKMLSQMFRIFSRQFTIKRVTISRTVGHSVIPRNPLFHLF